MKFAIFSVANRDTEAAAAEYDRCEAGELPAPEEFVKMLEFQEELVKAGVLIGGEGLRASSLGARLTFGKNGKTTIKNGPFTESKELIVGFSMIEAPSLDEAIAWMKRAPTANGGMLEIRPLFTDDDFGPRA